MQIKVQRKVLCFLSWILISGSICHCEEEEKKPAEDSPKHENFPRMFRIFSRPGDKNTEKQEGSSIGEHVGNVFRGGSLGFQMEARPLAPFHGLIDKAKDFIPNPFGQGLAAVNKAKEFFPIPFLPRPPKDKDTEVKPKPEDQWETAEKDGGPVQPGKDYDDGPKFEELDEKVDEEPDYSTIEPIENIIQPRIRQKRSPESRVFHVPLQFLSNAKPFEVKIK